MERLSTPLAIAGNGEAHLATTRALDHGGRSTRKRANRIAAFAKVIVIMLVAAPPTVDAMPLLGATVE